MSGWHDDDVRDWRTTVGAYFVIAVFWLVTIAIWVIVFAQLMVSGH